MKDYLKNRWTGLTPLVMMIAFVAITLHGCGGASDVAVAPAKVNIEPTEVTVVAPPPDINITIVNEIITDTGDGDLPEIGYVGDGKSYSPFGIFKNGITPSFQGWTYYKIYSNFNTNCSIRLVIPITITSLYVYNKENIELELGNDKGMYVIDVDESVFMDTYSVEEGVIEVFNSCWTERR